MPELVDECVELDRLNMTPVLAEAGETFRATDRKAGLMKSLSTNGRLVVVRRSERLAGYVELKFSEDRCAVWSIQVHPDFQRGPVLLELLRRAGETIDDARVRVVVSAVHGSNRKSIRLHRLVGFQEVGINGEKVRFEAPVATLMAGLGRRGHPPT